MAVRLRMGEWLRPAAVLAAAMAPACAALASHTPDHKAVLLVHSYSPRQPYGLKQQEAIIGMLTRAQPALDLWMTHLDLESYVGPPDYDLLASVMRLRYGPRDIALIITTDTPAFRFMLAKGREVFRGVPWVFSAVRDVPPDIQQLAPDATGVEEALGVGATLELIERLMPEFRRLLVVGDNTERTHVQQDDVEAAIASFDRPLQVEWLIDVPWHDLRERLSADDPGAAVLYLYYPLEHADPADVPAGANALAAVSGVPVFTLYESHVYGGVVGGVVAAGKFYGEASAALAVRILNGEKAGSIPVVRGGVNRAVVDARALKRWSLDRRRLPPGTIILNDEPSFLNRHGAVLLVGGVIVLLQACVIAGLLYQRRRRRSAERALRQSRERFRLLVERTNVVLWEADPSTFNFTFVSGRAEGLLGFPVQDWLRPGFWRERVHPDDLEAVEAFCRESTRKGSDHEITYRMLRRDGEVVWVRDLVSVVMGVSGPESLGGALVDVTAQHIAQEALRASEERFRTIAENVPGCVYTLRYRPDTGRRSLDYAGPGLERLLGRDVASAVRADFDRYFTLVSPDDYRRIQATADRAVATGAPFYCEYPITLPSGESRWVRSVAAHVPLSGGVQQWMGILLDATAEHRVEEALRASEERFRQITDNAREVFLVARGDMSRIEYLSPAFEEVWGCSVAEALADPARFIESVHPDDRERVDRARAAIGDGFDVEHRIIRPDGEVRWIRCRAYPIRSRSGRVERIAGVADDITDARRARDALARTAEVQQLLLGELDHRVKNSLAALLTLIDLMRRDAGTVEEFASSVRARVGAMLSVHTLLSEGHWAPVPIGRIIQLLIPAGAPGSFSIHGEPIDVPPRQVTALAMVIQELMTNSMKHGAGGVPGGRVFIAWKPEGDHDTRAVRLHWSEHGGPSPAEPVRPGLGLRLIEGFCKSELGGSAEFVFARRGVDHHFLLVLDRYMPESSTATTAEPELAPAPAG